LEFRTWDLVLNTCLLELTWRPTNKVQSTNKDYLRSTLSRRQLQGFVRRSSGHCLFGVGEDIGVSGDKGEKKFCQVVGIGEKPFVE